MLPLAIGMAAAGLFSQIYGGAKSGQAMDKANANLDNQVSELTSWYDTEKNKDFLQSNLGSSIINKVLQNVEEQNKINSSTAAVTGASDAAVLAAKGQNQEQLGQIMSQVASYGTQREQAVDAQYLGNKRALEAQRVNLALGEAENAGNLTSTGGSLLGSAAELAGLAIK